MYCINCGVKLADTEKRCPLCGVEAFHPELTREEAQPLYPRHRYPAPPPYSPAAQIVATTFMLMALFITLAVDRQINAQVTWSGYVAGALAMSYVILVLPYWFRKPNPVIFVPCGFAAVGLYLLYIDMTVKGGWFLGFAFPVTACIGGIVTAVVALLRYLPGGRLFIYGGASAALGLFMPVMEYLIYVTFSLSRFFGWSLYPLIALVLLGAMLIVLAVCRPARETMERKFFL